ncbi:MAG: hypothetical protein ABI999_12660 [Acidobacteriota bacterium]
MPIDPAKIIFGLHRKREFGWEAFYKGGQKKWQASTQFEVTIDIDRTDMTDLELASIEYRQYIRGGVWTRRGTKDWPLDSAPDGNKSFAIPKYAGQKDIIVPLIPIYAVNHEELDMSHYKEDGQIEKGGEEWYGYRAWANVEAPNEVDKWTPEGPSGTRYLARDTPSIMDDWGDGESVEVWIELYFKGFVVEVDLPDTRTRPIKMLKHHAWSYFFHEKLDLWGDATRLPDIP